MEISLTQINHAVYFSNVQSINYSFMLHLSLLGTGQSQREANLAGGS